ncbi:unnamed protein product [Meloidogyne enterolobii]|uniref:Uncharacterized protein n=1 Tax=Meloidogyne enterolobii TaxID=390850 RepID=A0ACB1AXB2_MELEN
MHLDQFEVFYGFDELEEMIDDIEIFSYKFQLIDKQKVKEKLQQYLPEKKWEKKSSKIEEHDITIKLKHKPLPHYISGAGPFHYYYKCC